MSELPLKTVLVTGPDAFEFLQNQLSSDLDQLESETEILSAWCSPKGRVIWFGTVQKTAPGFSLSVAADLAEELIKRLTVFRFRSKVEFTIEDGGTVSAADLIEKGYPFIGLAQAEQFTPHMLNLDLLGAVSVDKGCYPGQEIVARTHFRGATKRRLMRFESSGPVSPGDKVSDGSRDVGEVLNAVGKYLLAVVPVEKAEGPLNIGDNALLNLSLPYQ